MNRLKLILDDGIKIQPAIKASIGWIVKCHWRECVFDTEYQFTEDDAYVVIKKHIKEKHLSGNKNI